MRTWVVIGVLGALVGLGAALLWPRAVPPRDTGVPSALERGVLRVGSSTVRVEIARTPAQHARGLMERTRLAEDAGMLFVFDAPQPQTFWMKRTVIPLDFIWIQGGRVQGVTHDVQPEHGVPDDRLRRYGSPGPADWVLEVNAGWAARHGVTAGATVRLEE